MSHRVQIACVQFKTKAVRGAKESRSVVVRELGEITQTLLGHRDDLVVFSEGVEAHGQNLDQAEDISKGGEMFEAYQKMARTLGSHIAASMKTLRAGRAYNSVVFLDPDGKSLGVYDKVNLTQGEREYGLSPGAGPVICESRIGRLGGLVCFDLNFDNVLQGYRALRPDILVFPSMYHGGLMQGVFAYQCRSFFASALPFFGSGILDPFGRELKVTDCYTEIARTSVNLDRVMVHLDENRSKFPDIEKKYGTEVVVDTPPNVGPALIYSTSDKRSAMDIVREFGLELMDDYMARSQCENDLARNK